MKDAYSFDMSQEGLEKEYENMAKAYTRIFKRCGLNTKWCNQIPAQSAEA